MARCGCGSTCNCVITGDGVTGSGSVSDPYVIAGSSDCNCVVTGDGVTGSGSAEDPYVVAAGSMAQPINDDLSSMAGLLTPLNGTWAINAGVLRQSDTGAAARHVSHATAVTPAGARVSEVECDWVSGAGAIQRMGLIISSSNAGSGNLLVYALSTDGGSTWVIAVENDTVVVYLTTGAIGYAGSGYLRLAAIHIGTSVDVYANGVWIATCLITNAWTPGKYVGLYTYGCAADFKNLKAWTPIVSPL